MLPAGMGLREGVPGAELYAALLLDPEIGERPLVGAAPVSGDAD